jgi:preprotein translocase subunit YajC
MPGRSEARPVVNALPYVVIVVLLVAMLLFSMRNRRRQVAEEMVRVSRIGVGTEVMTTSGLYGTVVAKHDDGTVLLAIAPGVEVKWASAALRDADSLAETYRRPLEDAEHDGAGDAADPRDGGIELRKNADGDVSRKPES